MNNKRVLISIPAGNGVPVERVFAADLEAAKSYVDQGSSDKNSWYYGAEIITDVKEYPRYGYRECELNGVVKDDKLKSLTKAKYDALLNSRKKITADEFNESTQASIGAKLVDTLERVKQLEEMLSKSESQIESENYFEKKSEAVDMAMVEDTEPQEAQQQEG